MQYFTDDTFRLRSKPYPSCSRPSDTGSVAMLTLRRGSAGVVAVGVGDGCVVIGCSPV